MSTNYPYFIQRMVSAQFGTTPDAVQITPIRHGLIDRNNVWRLEHAGELYLLKQHLISQPIGASTFTPFQIESSVLSVLHQAGCRVPKIVWKSEPYLLLEWCGASTLEDLAQENPVDLTVLRDNVVRELCRIEQGFANHTHTIAPYVFPLNLHDTMAAILEQAGKTIRYLVRLGEESTLINQHADIDTVWTEFATRLQVVSTDPRTDEGTNPKTDGRTNLAPPAPCAHSPSLGSLDYNARNVVIDCETPTFIDFASVGWDWQARRLVQTLSSLGAYRPDGNFVTLLDSAAVELYINESENHQLGRPLPEFARRVDCHQLLFYLVAIYRLVSAVAQPDTIENRTLLRAWGDPKARLRRAVTLLADSRLSDDSCIHSIREFIAEFRQIF